MSILKEGPFYKGKESRLAVLAKYAGQDMPDMSGRVLLMSGKGTFRPAGFIIYRFISYEKCPAGDCGPEIIFTRTGLALYHVKKKFHIMRAILSISFASWY